VLLTLPHVRLPNAGALGEAGGRAEEGRCGGAARPVHTQVPLTQYLQRGNIYVFRICLFRPAGCSTAFCFCCRGFLAVLR
jgi:hypothetical protein